MQIEHVVSHLNQSNFRRLGIGFGVIGLLLADIKPQQKLSFADFPEKPILNNNKVILPASNLLTLTPPLKLIPEAILPKIDHLAILVSNKTTTEERFAALQVLLTDSKNYSQVYKFLLADETRQKLINEPQTWSAFYQSFLEKLAPNYQVAGSKIGGHFFRFTSTNGTVELRTQALKIWFDIGGDFGDLSQVYQANLSATSRLTAVESTRYQETTNRLIGNNILNRGY